MLDKYLVDLLICPKCGNKVIYFPDDNYLLCESCGKKYNVKNDIPIMLIDEDEDETGSE